MQRRTCVGCRRTRPRDELARLARTPDGVRYDRPRRAPGRGANICPDTNCIEAASQRGAGPVRRALRGAPEAEVRAALDELRRDISSDESDERPPPGATDEAPRPRPGARGDQAPDVGAVRSSRT